MFTINQSQITSDNRKQNYRHMLEAIKGLLEDESDMIASLANISAFINSYMDRINWVGFYIMKNSELVLGPFQGLPACIRIKMGAGVCGTAAWKREVVRIDNVHTFTGHIACDAQTNSEIVLPIFRGTELFGVLDLDSPDYARFGESEEVCLREAAEMISSFLSKQAHG